ncbi:sulfatase-like hydrolase/transferase [Lunatimonas salinarum]|uniref:sulfatase-like hydrolase/transferase n=1 Tax=Lunatimonas salinarum TaxID=1774590 RepID=UPI001FD783CB|nr:sulfatase-like hydrolase/transferase [Lunatimonas salinarum]
MYKVILCCLGLSMLSCAHPELSLPPPNILWITHEDMSPIYGCYGDGYARTPNLDALSAKSIRFTNAFANAPICAPARSTLITGMYATSLGTQHLRSEIPLPEGFKILPQVLQDVGYYTSNQVKTDYNFSPEGRWDDSSPTAHWRNRPEGKPFFSVVNFMITHEGPTNALRTADTESLNEWSDPEKAVLPPYIPDTPRMRQIWAHMYDLLAVFDQGVGRLMAELEEDGLLDNTIVFVFSDHGHGVPGHKRWLNRAGLQVPFLLHIPDKYRHLAPHLSGEETDQMVSFVDFAPTVIGLAGAKVPDRMEGRDFLARKPSRAAYSFGYRDRADDCYEVARSVFDGRYLYVRHFMPQLPYYQRAIIFQKQGSYEEFNRLKDLGRLPVSTAKMMQQKPLEELYDLWEDPHEQRNLIGDHGFAARVDSLKTELIDWMVRHRDTGILTEGIMMEGALAQGVSVYEFARQIPEADFRRMVAAAYKVGQVGAIDELLPLLQDNLDVVRFWALVALDASGNHSEAVWQRLSELLVDSSASVAIKAAEIMVRQRGDPQALGVLETMLKGSYEPVVLQAAISVRQLEEKALPLLSVIQEEVFPNYAGDVWGRYRSWSYPMFIGMALDQAQLNCGVAIPLQR